MIRISEGELLLVSEAKRDTLKGYSQGVELCARSGKSIRELQTRVAMDRLKLAGLHLSHAVSALKVPSHRSAVSRAYYAMYHAARAATYLSYGGDDHEQHSVLQSKLPADFPDSDVWRNRLKNARLDRNRADYEPYPVGDASFAPVAREAIKNARELIRVSRSYLKSKV